jgi:hypothetical protein
VLFRSASLPERFRRYIKLARIFEVEYNAYSEWIDDDKPCDFSSKINYFTMPFMSTVIEDKDSAILYYSSSEECQQRVESRRDVIVSYGSSGASAILCGNCSGQKYDKLRERWDSADFELEFFLVKAPGEKNWSRMQLYDYGTFDMATHFRAGYDQIMLMSNPSDVILEVSPKTINPKRKYKRTSERPSYTIVRPNEARRRMGLAELDHADRSGSISERRAHWRQEHTRTLRAESWGENRGKVINVARAWIPAIWYGEREGTVGMHKYRVILGDEKG